mmetsp:Transcript_8055/g.13665  ORF Transcript_8055/g.13665 Transcript_8055/m.13665 type:complete len:214 (+) Transcript_8055:205-846(+)
MTEPMYHEKQLLGHCAVHALNNLFQEQWVDFELMCQHSQELYNEDVQRGFVSKCFSLNPYKSVIPYYGDFDISVIVRALGASRRGRLCGHISSLQDIDSLQLDVGQMAARKELGYIVNLCLSSCPGFSKRHWFAVRREVKVYPDSKDQGGGHCSFWNLDSKLPRPFLYRSSDDLQHFLRELILHNKAQVFTVTTDIDDEGASPTDCLKVSTRL